MILNGAGIAGADGTAVYPGMAAAPKSYAFGTRLDLPGIGIVTVHDRGGAIQELPGGVHRLDLWVGSGEEGLARALAFGVRRLTATVYPVGSDAPDEHLDLAVLSAPIETLRPFSVAESTLLTLEAQKGDYGLAVKFLQEQLQKTGHFTKKPNGNFGDATEAALAKFQKDYGIEESASILSQRTAAFLSVVTSAKKNDTVAFLDHAVVKPDDAATLKRVLRSLGFYTGRTTPVIDAPLKKAVAAFQLDHKLIASDTAPAAGVLGPKTRKALQTEWRKSLVSQKAEEVLFVSRVKELVAEKGIFVSAFMGEGSHGAEVRKLQQFLADRKFLDREKVTGTFGKTTEKALIAYQLAAKVIDKGSDKGAGYVGPATIAQMRRDVVKQALLSVKAKGWGVL